MNLVTGEIVEILVEDEIRWARVSVGDVYMRTPLTLLPDARVGDGVLIESGVAISTIRGEQGKEVTHVSGNSR